MQQLVSQVVLPITLALIMLVMGMGLTRQDFKRVAKDPKLLSFALSLQLLFLPILALVIGVMFQLPATSAAGLFLLSLCPGGATSNMFSYLAKGDVALSVSLTAVTSLIVPFSLPICFAAYHVLFQDAVVATFDMPVVLMMKQLVAVTLVPVFIGMLLRHYLAEKVIVFESRLKKLAALSMITVILLLMATNLPTLVQSLSKAGVAVLALCTLALITAWLLSLRCGLANPVANTVAIEVGVQNAGTAMMVAFVVLNQAELAVIPLMYGLLMNIPAFAFVYWVNRKGHETRVTAV